MKFYVGYQLCASPQFLQSILAHRDQIDEVYFSWGNAPSGRSAVGACGDLLPWQAEERQRAQLLQIAQSGIGLNLLLNANCYGERSLSRAFYRHTGDTVDYLQREMRLVSVTTTSPLIARFLKTNFSNLSVKASVNMEISTIEGMEYLADVFDAFYLKRELNRSPKKILPLRRWCDDHGKKLCMLANSGCLNYCSARQFHDNLVAHEQEIAQMDNAFEFQGLCRTFLRDPARRAQILQYSNWIRPEDVPLFEGLIDGMKLATRVSPQPTQILLSYLQGAFSGNILELTEPNFSALFAPEVLNAHAFGADYAQRRYDCTGDCASCGYCQALYARTKETLAEMHFGENSLPL